MSARTPIKPDVPGRGAWTTTGGLLRLKPGSTNRAGYYRLAVAPEVMVGRAGTAEGASYSETVVHLGVIAWQRLLSLTADGLLGPATDRAIKEFQAEHRDAVGPADGILGPATALAILTPLIRLVAASHGVPVQVIGGVSRLESGLDPAAVGSNGRDTGLCQINLGAHDVTLADACDPEYALNWSAADLRAVHDRWVGKTKADPWKIAIANHNSPASAQQWARSGKPPFSQSRKDNGYPQIDEYVASVLRAGEVF